MSTEIHGFCDERFHPLRDTFSKNFDDGLEVGASLAVTHQGKTVVDLWAGYADWNETQPWLHDTIVPVMSTTKIPMTLSFLMLIDRGLVELDAPIARYWSEFAAGGKAHVTVRDALTHSAGVPGFDPPVRFEDQVDWDRMTANIARQAHWFGGQRVVFYHGQTYGFILGEIMRRVDGRKPSQFFREEIAQKAGIDFQMCLRAQDDCRRLARDDFAVPPVDVEAADPLVARFNRGLVIEGEPFWTWACRSADMPSSNGFGNGRSIARVCAIAAMGGELDGVRYLSEKTIAQASSEQIYAKDPYLGGWVRLGLGFGLNSNEFRAPSPTAFHWGGMGGSFGIMDPGNRISCGYAMNNLVDGAFDRRSRRLWRSLGSLLDRL